MFLYVGFKYEFCLPISNDDFIFLCPAVGQCMFFLSNNGGNLQFFFYVISKMCLFTAVKSDN